MVWVSVAWIAYEMYYKVTQLAVCTEPCMPGCS